MVSLRQQEANIMLYLDFDGHRARQARQIIQDYAEEELYPEVGGRKSIHIIARISSDFARFNTWYRRNRKKYMQP